MLQFSKRAGCSKYSPWLKYPKDSVYWTNFQHALVILTTYSQIPINIFS